MTPQILKDEKLDGTNSYVVEVQKPTHTSCYKHPLGNDEELLVDVIDPN